MADTFTENMQGLQGGVEDTTNPAIAAARGASPDQVKMAATPASKVGKLGTNSTGVRGNIHQPQTIQPPKVTEERRIRETVRYTDQVTEDQKLQAASQIEADESLKRLGNTGSAIKNLLIGKTNTLIDKSKLPEAGGEVALTVDQLPAAAQDEVKNLSRVWQTLTPDANGNVVVDGVTRGAEEYRNDLIGKLITAIGVPNAEGKVVVDPKLLTNLFPTAEDAVVSAFTTAMADHITVNDDLLKSMGYEETELPAVKTQLGLTGNETVTEYQDKVNSYRDKVIKPIEDLRANLSDPALTPSEREAAREELRDMGYVGALADAAKLNQLADDISVMDRSVKIGDKVYDTADDFLSDENVAGIVEGYLNGTIEAGNLPEGLSDLIDRNRDIFDEAVKELDVEVGNFKAVQDSWKPLKDSGLDPSVLKSVVPGFDPEAGFYTKAAPDVSNNNVLKWITGSDRTAQSKLNISSMINDLTTSGVRSDGIQAVMSGLDDSELERLQDDGVRSRFTDGIKLGSKVKDMMSGVDLMTPEAVITKLTGLESTDELVDLLNDLKVMKDFGDTEAGKLLDTLNAVYDPTSGRNTLEKFKGLLDFGDLDAINATGDIARGIKDRVSLAGSQSMGSLRTVADMAQGGDLASRDIEAATQAFDDAFKVKSMGDFANAWEKVGGKDKPGLKPIWDAKVASIENIVNTELKDFNDRNWESKAKSFTSALDSLTALGKIDIGMAIKNLTKFVPTILTEHQVSDQEMTDLINQAGLPMSEIGLNPNIPITQQLKSQTINRHKLNITYGPLVRINRMLSAAGKPPMSVESYMGLRSMVDGESVSTRELAKVKAREESQARGVAAAKSVVSKSRIGR